MLFTTILTRLLDRRSSADDLAIHNVSASFHLLATISQKCHSLLTRVLDRKSSADDLAYLLEF